MAYAHMTENLTLDEATDTFDHNPSDRACSNLLRTAASYHEDEMIEDGTLRLIIERVAEWLRAK